MQKKLKVDLGIVLTYIVAILVILGIMGLIVALVRH